MVATKLFLFHFFQKLFVLPHNLMLSKNSDSGNVFEFLYQKVLDKIF